MASPIRLALILYKYRVSDSDHFSLNPQLRTLIQADIDMLGTVKNTKETTKQPGQVISTKELSGAYSGINACLVTSITESCQTSALPVGLHVFSSVLDFFLRCTTTPRVFVDILSTSSKYVTIPSKHEICQLYRVDVMTGSDDQLPKLDTKDDIESSIL